MAKKGNKKRLFADCYDKIDKSVALSIMTHGVADKPTTATIPIQAIVEDVRGLIEGVMVSFNEAKRRIESWVRKGWVKINNNYISLTRQGRFHIGRIANATV